MSQNHVHDELYINDGSGNNLPIQTGTFVTKAVDFAQCRRLNITYGIPQGTGYFRGVPYAGGGGFTGIMLVQGTDEIANSNGGTGTPWAGSVPQPGKNSYTGALYWNTIPSGTIAITSTMTSAAFSFTDVGAAYIRITFNSALSQSAGIAAGSGGSGTMQLFITGKSD